MYFIGSGSLLRQAINHCIKIGVHIDGIICPVDDKLAGRFEKVGLNVIQTDSPNRHRIDIEEQCRDRVVFSINNKHILSDDMLRSGLRFYNIHNGLVQSYRGIAEVCIFAALCKGDEIYGTTLHRLLPARLVDSGPVVRQLSFNVLAEDDFENVFERSLVSCNELFKAGLSDILNDSSPESEVSLSLKAYGYKDIQILVKDASPHRLNKAALLGNYSSLLPKLQAEINKSINSTLKP